MVDVILGPLGRVLKAKGSRAARVWPGVQLRDVGQSLSFRSRGCAPVRRSHVVFF